MVDQTPTKDRAPVRTAGYKPADAHHVSAADSEAATFISIVAAMAPALARSAPAVLAMMRDHMMGQPQAAHYGPADDDDPDAEPGRKERARLWCWEHEQNTARCDEDQRRLAERGIDQPWCPGEQLTGPSDPVGNAAVVTDRAKIDHDQFVSHIVRAKREFDRAWAIASAWPAPSTPEEPDAGPGEDLCRCCWKASKYPQLIERHRSGPKVGQKYYRYLCRWCGDTRRALGSTKRWDMSDPTGDPPTFLVQAHIDRTMTQGKIDKAQRQLDGLWAEVQEKAKAKAASKKRKRK